MIGGSGIFNAQRPGHNERNIPAPPRPSQRPVCQFPRTDPFTEPSSPASLTAI
jgi:hypothetical protein